MPKLKVTRYHNPNNLDAQVNEVTLVGVSYYEASGFVNDLAKALGWEFKSNVSMFGGYYQKKNGDELTIIELT